ncbi:hypothetical protein J3A83DRAFT_4372298 [Scleroderma citrinum]
MNTIRTLAPAVLLASALFAPVQGAIYVTNPVQSTVCNGGQACPVQWVDDGQNPLLSAIGTCDIALYTGEFVLVQDLGSVDVSATQSFSFTPNPAAGPNGAYYLVFSNPAISYTGFSGSFTLAGMTGTTPGGGGGASSSTPSSTTAGTETATGTGPSTTGTATETTGTGTETASASTGTETPTTTTTVPATETTTSVSTILTTVASTTSSSHTTTTTHPTTTTTSTSTSTATNAAIRDGSSGSLVAFFLACAGALAF